ncbi:hypothetical protein VM1G_01362 [Cytospora mali]|uniref:Uncharacterized protein n=1 Tax=Cytospora mali TaxID=578113 RepID=A0A194VPS8_CYTMA|nr:hypothetical protein VM1G_01362 [Valsa mali]
MPMAKRSYSHNNGRSMHHPKTRITKRNESQANDHDDAKAKPSRISAATRPRPNDDSQHGIESFRKLKSHLESNEIQIIPVAANLPPRRSERDSESRASPTIPATIARGNSSISPEKPCLPGPVPLGTAGQTPSSFLELARARAFQDGVLSAHKFLQSNPAFPRPTSSPSSLTAGKLPVHGSLNNGPSMEMVESMYANIGQPVPDSVRKTIGEQGPHEPKQVERCKRRIQDADERLQKLQAER